MDVANGRVIIKGAYFNQTMLQFQMIVLDSRDLQQCAQAQKPLRQRHHPQVATAIAKKKIAIGLRRGVVLGLRQTAQTVAPGSTGALGTTAAAYTEHPKISLAVEM